MSNQKGVSQVEQQNLVGISLVFLLWYCFSSFFPKDKEAAFCVTNSTTSASGTNTNTHIHQQSNCCLGWCRCCCCCCCRRHTSYAHRRCSTICALSLIHNFDSIFRFQFGSTSQHHLEKVYQRWITQIFWLKDEWRTHLMWSTTSPLLCWTTTACQRCDAHPLILLRARTKRLRAQTSTPPSPPLSRQKLYRHDFKRRRGVWRQ